MRKGRKVSLAVSNVRRKIAHGNAPLFLASLYFFYSPPPLFPLSPWETSFFTPLKQSLDTLSNFAVTLETAFGLLVDPVNEQKELNTQIQIQLWSLQPWL